MVNNRNEYSSTKRNWIAGIIVTAGLFLLPFILTNFGKTGEYWIWVTTEMIIMGLFAMSLNLILGFGGMVSFGHAAFFGVGAYTVALLMKKAGVSLFFALAAAPVVAGLAAAVIGWFCVRLIGLYFAILTLAFSQLLYMIVFQWYTFTGGDDGIHGIPRPEFLGPLNYYLLCLVLFIICFLIMRMLVNSSFGLTIRTIRENLERAKFIGLNVRRFQWLNFIIAGSFAGLAGGLLTELNRFSQTEFLHWSKSAEPILGSLVGGMYSLLGPAIGSAVLIFMKIFLQQLHKGLVEIWAIILGLVLLVVVLFAPGGLVGIYEKAFKKS
ncbi:MAG: branched-chain amino acid ABC transporter permease [Desulfomonile tiedjei]|uniref:Branched-chain amino acid ABC transporter permease n=1 Tax=Desulfomonile tiedjei TaxID=2358 RepID=A0A9D6V2V8_9BACT|nr:branched-chain amino acid ABC transporter permease [Desulfomonile tiedjei]